MEKAKQSSACYRGLAHLCTRWKAKFRPNIFIWLSLTPKLITKYICLEAANLRTSQVRFNMLVNFTAPISYETDKNVSCTGQLQDAGSSWFTVHSEKTGFNLN